MRMSPFAHQNYYNQLTEAKWTVLPCSGVVLDEVSGRTNEPLDTLNNISCFGSGWVVITQTGRV